MKIIPFILQSIVWIPTRFILWFFLGFKVVGLNNLPKKINKNGIIFVANHSSELDVILLPAALPMFSFLHPIFYVSREKDFYNPTIIKKIFYGGFWFKLWGAYSAKVGCRDYQKSLANHIKILNKRGSLFIFPEGRKNQECQPEKAKGGVAYLSDLTKAPIIPVSLSGHNKITIKNFFLRKKETRIVFGKPLYLNNLFENIDDVRYEEYKIVAQKIMLKVKENLKK